jgi:hypothetical protein
VTRKVRATADSIGWSSSPTPLVGSIATAFVVAPTRPRKIEVLHGAQPSDGGTLRPTSLSLGVMFLPALPHWGTHLLVVQAPHVDEEPTPIAHRAGSTLWFANSPLKGRVAHPIEWVEPGTWYLVASHVTTERTWWDVISWGEGAGITIDAPLYDNVEDTGLAVMTHNRPLTIAAIEYHNRTFGHEEMLSIADAKELPEQPMYRWVPTVGANGSMWAGETEQLTPHLLGSLQPAHSWNASSARARKRALTMMPIKTPAYEMDVLVHPGPTTIRFGRGNTGFVVYGERPVDGPDEPMVSLLNTPYPDDEPGLVIP